MHLKISFFIFMAACSLPATSQPTVEDLFSREFSPKKFTNIVQDWTSSGTIKDFDIRRYRVVKQIENFAYQSARVSAEDLSENKRALLSVPPMIRKLVGSKTLAGTVKEFKRCSVEVPFESDLFEQAELLAGGDPFKINIDPNSFLEPYVIAVLFRLYSTLTEEERRALVAEVKNPSANFTWYILLIEQAASEASF